MDSKQLCDSARVSVSRRIVLQRAAGLGMAVALGRLPAAVAAPATVTPESGLAELVWTSPASGPGALGKPGMVNLDRSGSLWVADGATSQYVIFDPDGRPRETWGRSGSGEGEFVFDDGGGNIGDVAFAPDGTFYVADLGNRRVQKFGPDREFLLAWGMAGDGKGEGQFLTPNHLALLPDGSIYVADHRRGDVQRFDSDGNFLDRLEGTDGAGRFETDSNTAVAVAQGGSVYTVDIRAGRVLVFDVEGRLVREFGSEGSGLGQMLTPIDLALDASGNVHLTDLGNRRVDVFAPDGTPLGQWGDHGELVAPISVAIDGTGAAYIVDAGYLEGITIEGSTSNRLQKFALSPVQASGTPTP